jgi:hypothetical protein
MSCPDRDIFFCILKTDLVTFILSKFQLKQLFQCPFKMLTLLNSILS